jgi:hypothetical protein
MWILVLALVLLGVFSWLATRYNWFGSSMTKKDETKQEENSENTVCCGMHEVCENDSLLSYDTKIEYYDDEELDMLKDKSPDAYSDNDLKSIESVFYTLKPEDVAGWLRSLNLRQITLPEYLLDEAMLIVSERRVSTKNTQ